MDVELNQTAEEIAQKYLKRSQEIELEKEKAELDGIEIKEIDFLLDENNSQLFILKGMFESEVYFDKVFPYLNDNVFESDPCLLSIFKAFKAYYNSYKMRPSYGDIQADGNHLHDPIVSLRIIEDMIKLPQPTYDLGSQIYDITRATIFYENIRVETANYLQNEDIYSGRWKSKNLTFQEWRDVCDTSLFKKVEAMREITFDSNQGISFASSNIDFLKEDAKPFISTGIQSLDFLLGGGFSDKTLNVILAATGGGKTSFMLNCALTSAKAGYRVLYLSLEIPEMDILTKCFSHISKANQRKLRGFNLQTIEENRKKFLGDRGGDIVIKDYPAGSLKTSTIMAKLKSEAANGQYYDVVFIDYLGLMDSDRHYDRTATYLKFKNVAEELHALSKTAPGRDRVGIPIVTAVQSIRGAMQKQFKGDGVLDNDDISESIGIAQTADNIIAVSKIQNENYSKIKAFDLIEWIQNNPTDVQNDKRNFVSVKLTKNRNTGYLNGVILEGRFDYVKFYDIDANLKKIGCDDEFEKDYLVTRKNSYLKATKIRNDLNQERFDKIRELNSELLNSVDVSDAVIKEETYEIKDNGQCDVKGEVVVLEKTLNQIVNKENTQQDDNVGQVDVPIIDVPTQSSSTEIPTQSSSTVETSKGTGHYINDKGERVELKPVSLDDFVKEQSKYKNQDVDSLSQALRQANDKYYESKGITPPTTIHKPEAYYTNDKGERVEIPFICGYENDPQYKIVEAPTQSSSAEIPTQSSSAEIPTQSSSAEIPTQSSSTEKKNSLIDDPFEEEEPYYSDYFDMKKEELPPIEEIYKRGEIDAEEDVERIWKWVLPKLDCDEQVLKEWMTSYQIRQQGKRRFFLKDENRCKTDYESMLQRYQSAKNDAVSTKRIDIENRKQDVKDAITKWYNSLNAPKFDVVDKTDYRFIPMINAILSVKGQNPIKSKNINKALEYVNGEIQKEGNDHEYRSPGIPFRLAFGDCLSKDVLIKTLIDHPLNVFYVKSCQTFLKALWLFENQPFKVTPTYYYYRDNALKVKLLNSLELQVKSNDLSNAEIFVKGILRWATNGDINDMDVSMWVESKTNIPVATSKGGYFNIYQFLTQDDKKIINLKKPILVIDAICKNLKSNQSYADKLAIIESGNIQVEFKGQMVDSIKGNKLFPLEMVRRVNDRMEDFNDGVSDFNMLQSVSNKEVRKIVSFKPPKRNKDNPNEFIEEKRAKHMEDNRMYSNFYGVKRDETTSKVLTLKETISQMSSNDIKVELPKKTIRNETYEKAQPNLTQDDKSLISDIHRMSEKCEEDMTFTRQYVMNVNNYNTWVDKFLSDCKHILPRYSSSIAIRLFWDYLGYEMVSKNRFVKMRDDAVYIDNDDFNKKVVNFKDAFKGEVIPDDIPTMGVISKECSDVQLDEPEVKDEIIEETEEIFKNRVLPKVISEEELDEKLPEPKELDEKLPEPKELDEKLPEPKELDEKLPEPKELDEKLPEQIQQTTLNVLKDCLSDVASSVMPELLDVSKELESGNMSVNELADALKKKQGEMLSIEPISDDAIQQNINLWKMKGKSKGDIKRYTNVIAHLEDLKNVPRSERPIPQQVTSDILQLSLDIDGIPTSYDDFKEEATLTYKAQNEDDDGLDLIIKTAAKHQKGFLATFQRGKSLPKLNNDRDVQAYIEKDAKIAEKSEKLIEELAQKGASEEAQLWALNTMIMKQMCNDDTDLKIPDYILNPNKRPKMIFDFSDPFNKVEVVDFEMSKGELKREHIELFLQSRFVEYDKRLDNSSLEALAIEEFLKLPSEIRDKTAELPKDKREKAIRNFLIEAFDDVTIEKIKQQTEQIHKLREPSQVNQFKKRLISIWEQNFSLSGMCLDLSDVYMNGKLPKRYEYYTLNSYKELETNMFREFLTRMKIVCNPEHYKMFDRYKQFRNFKINLVEMSNQKELYDDISIKKANIIKGYYALENLERLWIAENEILYCKNKWLLPSLYRDPDKQKGFDENGDVVTRQNKKLSELLPSELQEYEEEVYGEIAILTKFTSEAHKIINAMKAMVEADKIEDEEFLKNLE